MASFDNNEMIAIHHIVEEVFEDSSSSDEEEFLAVSEMFQVNNTTRLKMKRIRNYVSNIVHFYSDSQFQSHFRMQRQTFTFILNLIGPEISQSNIRSGRPNISVEKQLLITLWILSTPDSYRSVCDRFDVGKATGIMCVRRVVRVLCSRANLFIQWPTNEVMEVSSRAFQAMTGFPNVIGAIDGTHISITAPNDHPEAYVNRKGVHSMQLQAICNEKGIFIHCYTGHPGSVHDQRVLGNSEVANFLKSNEKFPRNVHLLGDAAYTLQEHLMVPFKDNGHLTRRQKNYNFCHSSTRMAIERAFGLLKGRFRRLLDNLPMIRTDLIPNYIIACCVIHNICLLRRDEFQPLALMMQHNIPHRNAIDVVNRNEREIAIRKRDLIVAELPLRENE